MEAQEKATITAANNPATKVANYPDMAKAEANVKAHQQPVLYADMLENASDTFPLYGLPYWVQELANAMANGFDCPRDYIVPMLYSVVSTAIGKKVIMSDINYSNMLNLFIAIVGKSGTNKSAPLKRLYKPVQDKEAERYKKYINERNTWEANKRKGTEPVFEQLIISDSTPEAKYKILSQTGAITSLVDELPTAFANFDRYNKSGEVSQLLSLFDGDTLRISRKGETPVIISKPVYGFIGGIQPGVIPGVLGTDYFMTSGFNQRWLFAYPEKYMLTGLSEPIPEELETLWQDFIRSLISWEIPKESVLTLSAEAQKVLQSFVMENKDKVNATDNDYLASLYQKERIHLDRWAAITHIIRHSTKDEDISGEIDGDSMRYAVDCMRWFEASALKVYRLITNSRQQNNKVDISNGELLKLLYDRFNVESQSALARAIGITPQAVSKVLNVK